MKVYRNQVADALSEPVNRICDSVSSVLQSARPMLSNDISDTGIVLTGGGAKLPEIDAVLRKRTNLPVATADDPLRCVAKGTGQALELGPNLSHIVDYSN